jgi:phosphoglycolate phosphatase
MMDGVRRLILWDIDGTLLHTGSAGRQALELGAARVAGLAAAPHVQMSGKTDPQIVSDILAAAGVSAEQGADLLPAILAEAELLLESWSGRMATEGCVHPGVRALLLELDAVMGLRQTLVTGNIYPNALCKVRAFGLDAFFDVEVGAYGTDHRERDRLVPICLDRVRERRDETYTGNEVWVIGDTANDLSCARAAGVRCLLVGTGGGGFAGVETLGADAAVPDLGATNSLLELLLG